MKENSHTGLRTSNFQFRSLALIDNVRPRPERFDDAHTILGKCTRHLRVQLGGRPHGFTSLQAASKIFVRHHFPYGKGKPECDGKRKALWKGHDHDVNGINEVFQKVVRSHGTSSESRPNAPPNHGHFEDQDRKENTDLADSGRQPILAHLQKGKRIRNGQISSRSRLAM
jgi:hypothetical protein